MTKSQPKISKIRNTWSDSITSKLLTDFDWLTTFHWANAILLVFIT